MHNSGSGSADPFYQSGDNVQIIPMDEEIHMRSNGGGRRRPSSSGQWTGTQTTTQHHGGYVGYHTSDEEPGGAFVCHVKAPFDLMGEDACGGREWETESYIYIGTYW